MDKILSHHRSEILKCQQTFWFLPMNPASPNKPWNVSIPLHKCQQALWFQPWFHSWCVHSRELSNFHQYLALPRNLRARGRSCPEGSRASVGSMHGGDSAKSRYPHLGYAEIKIFKFYSASYLVYPKDAQRVQVPSEVLRPKSHQEALGPGIYKSFWEETR